MLSNRNIHTETHRYVLECGLSGLHRRGEVTESNYSFQRESKRKLGDWQAHFHMCRLLVIQPRLELSSPLKTSLTAKLQPSETKLQAKQRWGLEAEAEKVKTGSPSAFFPPSLFTLLSHNSIRKSPLSPDENHQLHSKPAVMARLYGNQKKRAICALIYTYQNIHPSFNQVENINTSHTINTYDCLQRPELPNLLTLQCQPSLTCPAGFAMVPWA